MTNSPREGEGIIVTDLAQENIVEMSKNLLDKCKYSKNKSPSFLNSVRNTFRSHSDNNSTKKN